MFGKNEIVGKKYFKDAPKDQLFVTSMFLTLQGEGPFAGRLAYFIRLAKCNLACQFCDTFFDDGDWLTFDEIESKIRQEFSEHGLENNDVVIVVTGGEPSLQSNLVAFLHMIHTKNIAKHTQIESNGIFYLEDLPKKTVLVVSPKCIEKEGKPIRYIKPNLNVMRRADCLKFVMEKSKDSPYSEVPEWAFDFSKSGKDVYISPMNVYNDVPAKSKEIRNSGSNRIDMQERSTVDEVISFWEPGLLNLTMNEENHKYVARYCMDNNFRMNLQMHLYASLA